MDLSNRAQDSVTKIASGEARIFFVALLFLAALSTSGCAIFQSLDSFSDSSGSVSDSLGSFSDSSESSSGSSGDETAYRNDLRDYTVAHVRAEGTPAALRLGISEVALTRGITNWEALPSTFAAVGAGFAEAGLSLADAAPYRNALARPDSASAESMIVGFNRVRMASRGAEGNAAEGSGTQGL